MKPQYRDPEPGLGQCVRDRVEFYVASVIKCADPQCHEWHVITQSPRTVRPVVDVEEVFDWTGAVN